MTKTSGGKGFIIYISCYQIVLMFGNGLYMALKLKNRSAMENDNLRYPEKVKHSFVSTRISSRKRNLVFYASKPWEIGAMYDGSNQGWEIHYRSPIARTWGCLKLPDGWQDMDRTWTAQDIYWEDKYDCKHTRERDPQVAKRALAF